MSYASFLARLIAWGNLVRENWPLILALYEAAKALYEKIGQPLPGSEDGVLQMVAATDDELNAEERLAELIDGDSPSVSLPGRFRQIYQFLKAIGWLDKLFGDSLGS